jgi:hypothetical protein
LKVFAPRPPPHPSPFPPHRNSAILAPSSAYPRSTLRSLLKAWSPSGSATLSSNFDALAFVAYLTFLQRLAKESRAIAEDGMVKGKGKKARRVVIGKKEIRRAKRVRVEVGC